MSGDKHSPEPWFLDGKGRAIDAAVFRVVGEGSPVGAEEANWRRIVACVNAVAGIPTEALESGALAMVLATARRLDAFVDFNESNLDADGNWVSGPPDDPLPMDRAWLEFGAALRALGRLP